MGCSGEPGPAAHLESDPFLKRQMGRTPLGSSREGAPAALWKAPPQHPGHPCWPGGPASQLHTPLPRASTLAGKYQKQVHQVLPPVTNHPPTLRLLQQNPQKGEPSGLDKKGVKVPQPPGVTPLSWRGAHPDSHTSARKACWGPGPQLPPQNFREQGSRMRVGGSATGGDPHEQRWEAVSRLPSLLPIQPALHTHTHTHTERERERERE